MENLKDRAGIYKIENVKNNKVYIGSAVNLHKRKCEHFLHLKNNYHVNNYLQSSFNKYGINCFKFIVIEFIDKIEDKALFKKYILEREQFWIDKLKPFEQNGYNLAKVAGSLLGYKKTKKQIENGATYGKTYGELYTAQAIINLDTGKVYDSLKRAADEYCMKNTSNISSVCRGFSETAGGFRWAYLDDKNNILYPNFKPKHMREILNINTNETFNSIVLAAKKYKVSPSAIRHVLTGRSKTCCGFEWKYKNDEPGRSKSKKVINVDSGSVFDSMNNAAKFYNINSKGISTACKRKNNKYGGSHWQYYEDYLKEHPENT